MEERSCWDAEIPALHGETTNDAQATCRESVISVG